MAKVVFTRAGLNAVMAASTPGALIAGTYFLPVYDWRIDPTIGANSTSLSAISAIAYETSAMSATSAFPYGQVFASVNAIPYKLSTNIGSYVTSAEGSVLAAKTITGSYVNSLQPVTLTSGGKTVNCVAYKGVNYLSSTPVDGKVTWTSTENLVATTALTIDYATVNSNTSGYMYKVNDYYPVYSSSGITAGNFHCILNGTSVGEMRFNKLAIFTVTFDESGVEVPDTLTFFGEAYLETPVTLSNAIGGYNQLEFDVQITLFDAAVSNWSDIFFSTSGDYWGKVQSGLHYSDKVSIGDASSDNNYEPLAVLDVRKRRSGGTVIAEDVLSVGYDSTNRWRIDDSSANVLSIDATGAKRSISYYSTICSGSQTSAYAISIGNYNTTLGVPFNTRILQGYFTDYVNISYGTKSSYYTNYGVLGSEILVGTYNDTKAVILGAGLVAKAGGITYDNTVSAINYDNTVSAINNVTTTTSATLDANFSSIGKMYLVGRGGVNIFADNGVNVRGDVKPYIDNTYKFGYHSETYVDSTSVVDTYSAKRYTEAWFSQYVFADNFENGDIYTSENYGMPLRASLRPDGLIGEGLVIGTDAEPRSNSAGTTSDSRIIIAAGVKDTASDGILKKTSRFNIAAYNVDTYLKIGNTADSNFSSKEIDIVGLGGVNVFGDTTLYNNLKCSNIKTINSDSLLIQNNTDDSGADIYAEKYLVYKNGTRFNYHNDFTCNGILSIGGIPTQMTIEQYLDSQLSQLMNVKVCLIERSSNCVAGFTSFTSYSSKYMVGNSVRLNGMFSGLIPNFDIHGYIIIIPEMKTISFTELPSINLAVTGSSFSTTADYYTGESFIYDGAVRQITSNGIPAMTSYVTYSNAYGYNYKVIYIQSDISGNQTKFVKFDVEIL